MIQSGEFNILDLINPAKAVYKIANEVKDLSKKGPLDEIIKTVDFFRSKLPDPEKVSGTVINLTNN